MSQDGANALLIEHMLDQLGQNMGEALKFRAQRRLQEKQISLQSITKVKDFMSLPPDKRKALLLDPSFRQDMIKTLDPEAFSTEGGLLRRKKREGKLTPEVMAQKNTAAMALGDETNEEKLKRLKEEGDASKSIAEGALAQQRLRLSTGVEAATPMSLLIAGDVKDPIANALFSLIPKEQLKNIALNEKKAGPMYQQEQQQTWYKWAVDQGMPLGTAMTTGIAIAKGEWDKVPTTYMGADGKTIPIRGKAEQELATQAITARARMMEVNNTIEGSIATSAAQLAEKAGMPLDQARANIIALRAGKPTPFPTPHLAEMAQLDELNKKQEIEKNTQTILNDKYGVGMIKETLTGLLSAYKSESGFVMDGAAANDLKDKINKTTEALSSALAGRYGIKYEKYEDLHTFGPTVKAVTSSVWNGMKATGAFATDFADAVTEALHPEQVPAKSGVNTPTLQLSKEGPSARATPTKPHTLEQEKLLKSLSDSFTSALNDPNVPPEQKDSIKKYVEGFLLPAYKDSSKFNDLFNFQPPQEQ